MKIGRQILLIYLCIYFLLCFNNLFTFPTYALTYDWQWAKRLGGTGSDVSNVITKDSSGNIFVVGYAIGNVDLNGDGDSTDGGAEDATGYGSNDIVLSKLSSTGIFQWAKRLGGTSSDSGNSVFTDSSNNVYLIGNVSGNADLNGDGDSTDGGAESSTGYGSNDVVLVKFNATGTFQWAKRLGGTGSDGGNYVYIDSGGNIFASFGVTGNADVNGDGDSTDGGAESSTGYGSADVVLSKFSSTGAWQWAKRFGSTSNDFGSSVVVDNSGNILQAMRITGNGDVNGDGDSTDGGAEDATGYGSTDLVVSKFNSAGTFQWAKRVGSVNSDSGYVTFGPNGEVYIIGNGTGSIDVNGDGDSTDGGAEDATGYGSSDIFISKFTSSGTFQWAKRLGGTGSDQVGRYTNTDSLGNVLIAGYVTGNADLNGDGDSTDGGAEDAAGYGLVDIMFSIFDASGMWVSSKRIGGVSNDIIGNAWFGSDSTLLLTGSITGDADVNGDGDFTDGGAESSIGYGSFDILVTVFSWITAAPAPISNNQSGPVSVVPPPQISNSSSPNSNIVVVEANVEPDNVANKAVAMVAGDTFSFDAFFSSKRTNPIDSSGRLPNPITGTAVEVPANRNLVHAGDITTGNGFIGIRQFNSTLWQVGQLQNIWYKAYGTGNTISDAAHIIPDLQTKPSTLVLSYDEDDLFPPGVPGKKYSERFLKIAKSSDGINWTILPFSVVNPFDNTVAVVDKIGGYYMVVGGF